METGKSNIFWGLIVKPSKRYETTVQEAFRITKACIEPASAKSDVSSVFIECDNQEEFIVANLQSKNLNESLDLTFGVGEKICFKVEGPGTVHLTGYLMEDDQPSADFCMEDSDMEDSGESEDDDVEAKIKETQGKEALKRKTAPPEDVKKKKKPKLEDELKPEAIEKAKKAAEKLASKSPAEVGDDEDDSSEEEDSSDPLDSSADPAETTAEPADTTGDTTLGDLDDTENFAEEEDSDSDDSDDSDDSEEEVDTSGGGVSLGDINMGTDDDSSDDEEYTPPKEKEIPKKKDKTPLKPKVNGDVKSAVENPTPLATTANTPLKNLVDGNVTKSEKKKKKEKIDSLETPKKDIMVNGESDIVKSEKKKKNKEAIVIKQAIAVAEAVMSNNKQEEVLKTPKQEKKGKEAKTPKQAKTPKEEPKTPKEEPKTPKSTATPGKTPKRTLKGGILVEDTVVGSGAEVTPGSVVGMYYTGKLKSNKQFDSCTSGKPFKFKIGKGSVIKGWDIGIMGMKVGGKRTLIIPAQMGYGAQGAPPDIPGNASLFFDVECKFVK